MEVDILSWLDDAEPVISSVTPVKSTSTLTSGGMAGTCFEIKREVLLALLEKVMPVVPSRDIVPVLTNLQFTAKNSSLRIVASSLEMSIVVETNQVQIKQEGVDVFPAKMFVSVIKEADANSTVYVEATETGLVIVANAYTAELGMFSGRGFPVMEPTDDLVFHEINRRAFIDAISSVKYALPNKEFSGQESMKMISIKGGKFTACDGSRFQQVRIPGFKLSMQLPANSIALLLKFLSSTDMENVEVAEVTHKLIFKLGSAVLYRNKMTDPYPNVEQLWLRPALSNDIELLVDRDSLITAIKQVKVTADSTNNAVGMVLDNNEMKVLARDSTGKSSSTTIACKWEGKLRNVVVNYIHLAEMLRTYPNKECRFLLGVDSKTHKSLVLLKDDDTMSLATVAQMHEYRVGLTS